MTDDSWTYAIVDPVTGCGTVTVTQSADGRVAVTKNGVAIPLDSLLTEWHTLLRPRWYPR
jgi:hypothetical protein